MKALVAILTPEQSLQIRTRNVYLQQLGMPLRIALEMIMVLNVQVRQHNTVLISFWSTCVC